MKVSNDGASRQNKEIDMETTIVIAVLSHCLLAVVIGLRYCK